MTSKAGWVQWKSLKLFATAVKPLCTWIATETFIKRERDSLHGAPIDLQFLLQETSETCWWASVPNVTIMITYSNAAWKNLQPELLLVVYTTFRQQEVVWRNKGRFLDLEDSPDILVQWYRLTSN